MTNKVKQLSYTDSRTTNPNTIYDPILMIRKFKNKNSLLGSSNKQKQTIQNNKVTKEEDDPSRHALCRPPRRRSAPVTDVLQTQWLQCFAAMVGVLSHRFPAVAPELMAYQATIIKCSRNSDSLAWAQYDRAYRQPKLKT